MVAVPGGLRAGLPGGEFLQLLLWAEFLEHSLRADGPEVCERARYNGSQGNR